MQLYALAPSLESNVSGGHLIPCFIQTTSGLLINLKIEVSGDGTNSVLEEKEFFRIISWLLFSWIWANTVQYGELNHSLITILVLRFFRS